jgi:periplasmic protein TonB
VAVPVGEVTDVLRARQRESDGLATMTAASVLLHAALMAAVVLAPGGWLSAADVPPPTVMTISLGDGAPGPANGGLTSASARAVQAEAPVEPPKLPEPVRAPAARTPEMTIPTPQARPRAARVAQAPVKEAPDEAKGRTPTRGAQPSFGAAMTETGARGQGFGLSTGGGAGSGSRLDVADFCCPDYLVLMIERIRSNWNARAEGVVGDTMVKFTIRRDGRMDAVQVERSSGFTALDLNAQRAVLSTQTLPPLPEAFPNPTLTVHLNFQYTR